MKFAHCNELDNGTQYTFDDIIGESEIMYELKEKAYKERAIN